MSTRHVILVDFSSVLHPIWHMESTNPDPNATSTKVVERIRAIASGQQHVALACDKGPYFRKDISADYKATRGEPIAELLHQGEVALDILRGDGFPVWAVKGFEADDILASSVARLLNWYTEDGETRETATIQIVSQDKDVLQLIQPRVTVRKLTDGSVWDDAAVVEKFGIHATQVCDFLCLCGDSADNVLGAKGVGPKKAAELLKKFGTIEDLFVALTEHGTLFTPGLATNLREFEPRMASVRALITLRTDVAVPFDEVFKERVPADTAMFAGGEMDDIDATMQPLTEEKRPDPPVDINKVRAEAADRVEARLADANAQHRAEAEREAAQKGREQAPAPAQPTNGAQSAAFPAREGEVLPAPSNVFEMQLEPRSLREAALLAQEMFKSRLFSAYGTYQGVLSTVLAGRELGIQAMASLRSFHILDNKPTMSADLIRGLVQRSPLCEYFRCVERTPEKATWATKRKGDPVETTVTYTLEQGRAAWAKDQKAWDASAWGKRPVNMVTKCASTELARLVYADVVGNMYSVEELSGEERS